MQDLSPIAWALRPLKKYASPSGRASRAEYWWFYLLYVILYIVAVVLDLMLGFGDPVDGFGGFTLVVALGLFLPMIMVGIRRLHDTGKSGWWMFIALIPLIGVIVLLVFYCTRGDEGSNDYGPDPYSGDHLEEVFA